MTRKVLLLALMASGVIPLVSAQEKKQEPPQTVVIEAKQSLTVPDQQKAAETLDQTPGNVDIVSGDAVRAARAADLADALKGLPGVYLSTRHGQEYRFSIRGSGLQRNFHLQGIKLLEDGIPMNLADGFGDFNMIDPRSMEYVEVYRGANAFELGSAMLGGAVNFVSRNGRTASSFDMRMEAGSWKYLNLQLAAAHVAGAVDVYGSAGHYSEDGFRPHSTFDTQRFAVNAGYRFDDQWETRVYLDAVRTVAELPGTLTQDQVHHDRRASNPLAESEDWHRDIDLLRLADKTTWRSGDQQIDFGAYWMYNDLFHPLIWFPFLNLGILDQLTNDYGAFGRYTNDQKIGGGRNRLVAGTWVSGNRMRDLRFQNPNGNPGAPKTADGLTDSVNLTGYAQDQFWLSEAFSVVAGLNATYTSRDYRDRFLTDVDGDQSFATRYVGVNPMAGARYQITPTSQIFTNVSRSFEPPQFGELLSLRGGPTGSLFYNPLRAQRATTAEIGTRGKEGIVQWELAYYYAWLHRELIAVTPLPGFSTVSNADRTAHQGIELGAEITLFQELMAARKEKREGDRIYFRPAYTWNHFKFRNDPQFGDHQLPGIPEHLLQGELGYLHPSGAFLGLNVEWVPFKYPADYANSVFADRYATFGAKLGYRTDSGLSFFFEVRNLTDQRYVNSVNTIADAAGADLANFHPAFARSYYLGMEARW